MADFNSAFTGTQWDEAVRKALQMPELKGEKANFAALPGGASTGDVWLVIAATGFWPFTRKSAGYYRWSGSAWVFMGNEIAANLATFAAETDPATDAATSTSNIDNFGGVVITTTTTGNAQTLQSPTDANSGRSFAVINDPASSDDVTVNSIVLAAGAMATFVWDASAWITEVDQTAGGGDVVGPASAVDDRISVFDSTSGKLIKDGGQTIAQIEASTANVTTAGALMDSELTSIADVKALDQSVVSGASPTFDGANITGLTVKLFSFPFDNGASALATGNSLSIEQLGTHTLTDLKWTSKVGDTGAITVNLQEADVTSDVQGSFSTIETLTQLSGKDVITKTGLSADTITDGKVYRANISANSGSITGGVLVGYGTLN